MDHFKRSRLKKGTGCRIARSVCFLESDCHGAGSLVSIGNGVVLREGSIIYGGVTIGNNVTVDHYCVIREGTAIGDGTRIMNYTDIGRDVRIGRDCRIAGFLANRVVIGCGTSCFGSILHVYGSHGGGRVEEAPVIGDGVVVARGAVLAGGIRIADGARIRAGEVISPAMADSDPRVSIADGSPGEAAQNSR